MSSRHIASGQFGDRASSSKVTINIHETAPQQDEIHQCGSHSPRDTNKEGSTDAVNIDNTEYSIIGYEDPIKLNERCVTFNVCM